VYKEDLELCVRAGDSLAIAKMTARCAL